MPFSTILGAMLPTSSLSGAFYPFLSADITPFTKYILNIYNVFIYIINGKVNAYLIANQYISRDLALDAAGLILLTWRKSCCICNLNCCEPSP